MFKKFIARLILITFFFTSVGPLPDASAQSLMDLPAPGMMVNRSNFFEPLQLKGILVNIKNPLRFDFLVDKGDSGLYGQPLKDNITRLAKYFLTCLTVPEDDLWVNLSPYEKDRIVPGNFGITIMGKDLLVQDYLLKQIMASLSYPENELGKRFWQKVYRRSYELYGTTDIPINTFNKVWITPKSAQVYVQGNAAFVVNSQLDVMLEADYKAFIHHSHGSILDLSSQGFSKNAGAYSQVFRDVILPELRDEINEGKNFAVVRQVYNAMILATWYKRHLKDSLLGKMYVGQNKVKGVDVADKSVKERIFQQYLRAYKKCVYNYIKEDYDPATNQIVPRKYASGGMYFVNFSQTAYNENGDPRAGKWIGEDLALATVDVSATNSEGGIVSFPDMRAKITDTNPFHQVPLEVNGIALPREAGNFDPSNNAMLVPNFLRPVFLALALAVGGIMMSPSIASAASPVSPNVHVTANMDIQGVVNILDQRIKSYKVTIDKQDSIRNIFGFWGDSDDSRRILGGLVREDSFTRTLLADGKLYLDRPTIASIEVARLSGQIEEVTKQIEQREQKIKFEKIEFAKKDRSHDMHAGEISIRQGRIRYDEGVLKSLNAWIDDLSKDRQVDEDLELASVPAQELAKQVVSNAIDSGVSPVTPLPVRTTAAPSTRILVTSSIVSADHTGSLTPAKITPPAQSTLINAPVASNANFNLISPLSNPNVLTNAQPQQLVVSPTVQLSLSSENHPVEHQEFAGSAPPPPPDRINSAILQDVSARWAWYAGIAMLGVGISVGGASILKRNKLRKLNVLQAPAPVRSSGFISNNNGHSEKWGFNVVTDNGPAIPDDAEITWQQQQQQQQSIATSPAIESPMPSTENVQPLKSGLRVMDVLGVFTSAGIAAVYSGGDLKTMLTVALSSLLVTRLIYAGYTFLHENIHNGIALVQSPTKYKKILTWPNFFVNYNLPNWLRLGMAFGKPTQLPGVDLPLTPAARRFNQIAAFTVTGAISGLAFWTAAATGLWLPLFGSLSAASLFAVLNSLDTDILNPTSEGRIHCGDSGFIWLPKKIKLKNNGSNGKFHIEDFFPEFVQKGLINMRQISGLRGDQGEGLETYIRTSDGDVIPIGNKNLKDKRGKPVAEVAQQGFKEKIKDEIDQGAEPLNNVREVITHDRFLTQGIPSLGGLHPHLGVIERRELCYFENGIYHKGERTVVTTVIENGDNNYHKKHGRKMPTREIRQFYPVKFHMEKNVFIEPNAKFPDGYYDYLPSGDTPALALQEQWYDNQGDWWAASRFAADEVFYKNDKEAMEYNLSKEEVNAMGDFYMRVFENGHEQILIRPKLEKKNKSLADSWVTEKMAGKDVKFVFQYNALQQFCADLKRALLIEADKARKDENASVVGNILDHLQDLHPEEKFEEKLDRFVNMTVERFFTADILEAAKEIDRLEEEGAYGVRILSTKYPGRGVFWTKGQSVALGVNKEAGYMAYNSEHTALMSEFGDAPPVKEILFLNSEGAGQLTETNYNEDTQELDIRAWSPALGRFLKENELKEWRMPLNDKNRYWTPLLKRDPSTVTDEDIDDITKVTRDVKLAWGNPDSFVRQSADNLVDKLESRFVEDYIKSNSRFYKVMQGKLLYAIEQEAQQCHGNQCNSVEYQGRVASLLREVQNDPRILSFLKSRLDQLVAYEADVLSQQIRKGRKSEDHLFSQLKVIDQQLSELIYTEIRILTKNLIDNNVQFLRDFQGKQSQLALDQTAIEELWDSPDDQKNGEQRPDLAGQGLPQKESIGSGDAVIFAAGLEDSLWIGAENFRTMMNVFFPRMVIGTDSSNKALDLKPGDRHKVGRRTIGMIISKSGATSPSKNLVGPLKQITTIDNIFATTGTVDTLLGLSLGQKYDDDSPFSKRIFPTGHVYPTEVNSLSEIELLVNQIEMILYIVKRMKKDFPNQRPWGMNVSVENIKKIEEWRDNLVNKARHLTGIDEDGNHGTYPEHEAIIQNGRIYGKMIAETPLSNLLNRGYVFGIIYLGTPIGLLAAYIEKKTGVTLHSSGWGHLTWAILDTAITCSMPWFITTGLYRLFSGRVQRKARLGPPKVFIGDISVLHQVIELSASKRGSNAIGTMDADIQGGNPQDHFGARFGHRTGGRPGKLLIFGLPEDPHAFTDVTLTLSQCNVKTDMSIGWKIWDTLIGKRNSGSPETFTIGPEDNIDPNLSQHHMSTGSFQTVFINANGERELKPGVTETLAQFHANSFEVFDRLVAYNVFFNEGYHYATHWGPWQIWRQGETHSKTGVFSTPSPRGGPKKALAYYVDTQVSYSAADIKKASNGTLKKLIDDGPGKDHAMVTAAPTLQVTSRNGGITMNSRLMKLSISGDAPGSMGDDGAMSANMIKGVIPQVSQIVTVTPDMLKAMLGAGYLN